jgi:hypothetical protein
VDLYTAERVILDRQRDLARAAERRARLMPQSRIPVRMWMAGRLRSLADRLEPAPARSIRIL